MIIATLKVDAPLLLDGKEFMFISDEIAQTPIKIGENATIKGIEKTRNIVLDLGQARLCHNQHTGSDQEPGVAVSECSNCPVILRGRKSRQVFADLDTNRILFNGRAIPMAPAKIEFLSILIDCFPRTARHDHLIARLWGQAEPEDARNNLKVYVYQIRRELAGSGVTIRNIRNVGYVLDFNEEEDMAAKAPKKQFTAIVGARPDSKHDHARRETINSLMDIARWPDGTPRNGSAEYRGGAAESIFREKPQPCEVSEALGLGEGV